MNKEELLELRKQLLALSEEERIERDLYLKKLASGDIQGPKTGLPSIDKPWMKYYTEKEISTKLPNMSAYSYLYSRNAEYQERIALSYFGRKITFRELFDNIDKAAAGLKASGINEGDIVSISLPNIPEAVYLFYAVSKIGAIANMIDPRTSIDGIESYVKESGSNQLIMIDNYFEKGSELLKNGSISKLIAVSPAQSLPLGLQYGYKAKEFVERTLKKQSKIVYNEHVLNWNSFITEGEKVDKKTLDATFVPNRPLVIEHTGGTTGNPKGVVLSNENINAVALQSVLTGIDMQREHNWLDIMPTFIAYGVGMGLHLPLTIGMETILIPQFDAKKFDELLYKYKPIHMVFVPSYWGTIINSKKLAKQDLSYIIAPTVGGDSMDTTLEEEANKFLADHNCTSKVVKGYGMTEICGGVSGTVDQNNEIGSVGIPFVKTTISVFEPGTDNELGYNQNGEICVNTPNMMLGYLNNEEATNNVIKQHSDGSYWVHTGDIGYMNERGSVFIVDRIKRMMIRYDGFKIFPSIIENAIASHPAVELCKVVALDDLEHRQGKLPKAHIVLKEEYKGQEHYVLEGIKEICAEKLAEYVQPVDYQFRDELPLTPIGKIDYRQLEEEDRVAQQNNSAKVRILK